MRCRCRSSVRVRMVGCRYLWLVLIDVIHDWDIHLAWLSHLVPVLPWWARCTWSLRWWAVLPRQSWMWRLILVWWVRMLLVAGGRGSERRVLIAARMLYWAPRRGSGGPDVLEDTLARGWRNSSSFSGVIRSVIREGLRLWLWNSRSFTGRNVKS